VQYVLVVVLIGALAGAVVLLADRARRRMLRAKILAHLAHDRGLRFDARDPFGLPGVYRDFALLSAGHSPQAENVAYGHVDGAAVKTFDFRCECGHGIRRVVRHYHAMIVEPPQQLLPAVLMWPEADIAAAPMNLQRRHWRLANWLGTGDRHRAVVLQERMALGDVLGVESCGQAVMLWGRVDAAGGPESILPQTAAVLSAICEVDGPSPATTGARIDNVSAENRPT